MFKRFFIAAVLILGIASTVWAEEERGLFNLMDAKERGTFNIGLALGGVFPEYDKDFKKEVLKFEYTAAPKTMVGVWTKTYPDALSPEVVDAIKIGVKVPPDGQFNQVVLDLEIKGKKAWQKIPLQLKPGLNFFREPINWNKIGEINEVVFVVSTLVDGAGVSSIGGGQISAPTSDSGAMSPIGGVESIKGILYFDIDFYKMTFVQKYFMLIKVGMVILFSIFLALLSLFLGRFFPLASGAPKSGRVSEGVFSRLLHDFQYGIAAALVVLAVLMIYSLGLVRPLEAGFNITFLIVGLIGLAIAELFKSTITGKHLTTVEIFQNLLFAALLAASSSCMAVLQAPSSWVELVMLNKVIASIAFSAYHISNARSLALSGKHIRPIIGISIIGIPYLLNWLLLLEDITIIQNLIRNAFVGRLIVAFIFNEMIVNGFSLVLKGRPIRGLKLHAFLLFVSLGVVAAPIIADLGSARALTSLPDIVKIIIAVLTTMFAFAGLWGEAYLITGMALDGGKRTPPTWESISTHVKSGMRKGMAYSGILLTFMYVLSTLLGARILQSIAANLPLLIGIISGALVFPLLKTVIETFDGSLPFFQRAQHNYRDKSLYARGVVAGLGFAYALTHGIIQWKMSDRILFGLVVGVIASGGMSIFRDAVYAFKGQGKIQSWRMYIIDSLLGAFIGSALAFYLDTLQVPIVIEKFRLYTSSRLTGAELHRFNSATFSRDGFYSIRALLNKGGLMNLGLCTGGAKLLFTESLAGVILWSFAAWLFAINKVFMLAFFEKHTAPIKFFFSREGFAQLVEHMIYVMRWGLWMSPIIFTFLRIMPDPTWYNQDGAIRTVFAVYNNAAMSPEAFRQWSLNVFTYIIAFDIFRVLIWMDHMGLRVATLVNLSFIGLDRLDEKFARFIGPAAAQRYIPEAVKRFATWGPLLIPFYMPRGREWDHVWNTSEAMQKAGSRGGLIAYLQSLTLPEKLLLTCLAILIFTGISFGIRRLRARHAKRRIKSYELANREYKVILRENGEVYSEVMHRKSGVFPPSFDISRRSYDIIDPCGRVLYLVDTNEWQKSAKRAWPIVGNFPKKDFAASDIKKEGDSIKISNSANGIKTTIDIKLIDQDTTAEIWEINVRNLTNNPRQIKIVPYLEWVLNGGLHDRFHTQYARLFSEMEYVSKENAILAWQRSTKCMGVIASDISPEGILFTRVDFIGRAQSIWNPRVLKTLDFMSPRNNSPYPTFDPIGSFIIDAGLNPKASKKIRLMIGYAKNREGALELVNEYLKPRMSEAILPPEKKKPLLIGHGEILPGTPQPYCEYTDDGKKLLVRTPYTPRPFDHAMSNALEHSVMVTNRGLHASFNGNSQQNRLTPDWPDTATKEIPSEAIYLYDVDQNKWHSPTHHPLNKESAKNEVTFGVDGTAVFRMKDGNISTELVVFVPPDDPLGIYLLTIKNNSDRIKRMRIAPYFQVVLEFQPERSGTLQVQSSRATSALYFSNPRNMFHTGWAFATMSVAASLMETKRGRFFGTDCGVKRPFMVENGKPDKTEFSDDRQVAAFMTTVNIPAHEERTIAVCLGQAPDIKQARQLVQKYRNLSQVRKSLEDTRKWWLNLMGTIKLKTSKAEFDYLEKWLKYQALAERVWARRGFYQTSGAYGFRDQLQDTINLIWMDPALARKQIILHARHQFFEGDVFHWFFVRTDGRTAFSCRSHASDNPVWLLWAVVEYIKATGDCSILNEKASYVWSEFPFADLPKNKAGWGHLYHRSTRTESIYRHCLRSIDLVLERRMGKNGLPLIRTGDWNDGLDEIGSEGRGESVWLGFFLYYSLKGMIDMIEKKDGIRRKKHYIKKMKDLASALESTWRIDRYLRAIHDDGTEIGVKDSGIWEIDALTAAWAVMADINFERGLKGFNTALDILEKDKVVLLGWPALREDSKPYLGRSSKYPEGVRENGMYCHGVQWLIKAARILAEKFEKEKDFVKAGEYREITYRLWLKITPVSHVTPEEIEIYGGQPNKQPADILTTFDRGRMIWNGYTGAAGWLFNQALGGVVGATLVNNKLILPPDLDKSRGELQLKNVNRDVSKSPISR